MNITKDIKYVGVNDHVVDLFEGQYVVPNGMAYNSYAIIDEKIAIMDTVDAAFTHEWLDNIRDALEDMVHAIFDLAARYGLTWQGQSVESLIAGGYNVSVKFDDSIIEDKAAEIDQGVMLVGAGLLSKYTFLTDKKYGQGMTPEEAEEELKRIREENQQTVNVDQLRLFGGME